MLTNYLHAAMGQAKYEIVEGGGYYGTIPGLQGVWANAPSLEACRAQLEQVLEDWLVLSLSTRLPIPVIEGIELKIPQVP